MLTGRGHRFDDATGTPFELLKAGASHDLVRPCRDGVGVEKFEQVLESLR